MQNKADKKKNHEKANFTSTMEFAHHMLEFYLKSNMVALIDFIL